MSKVAAAIFVLSMSSLLGGCSKKTDFYDTLNDAYDARVFEKGWLPRQVMPPSSNKIRVNTLVDVASGDGSFEFTCSEYPDLRAKLRAYDSKLSKISGHNELIERRLAKGYKALSYSTSTTNWIFLCKESPGDCGCDFVIWQPDSP